MIAMCLGSLASLTLSLVSENPKKRVSRFIGFQYTSDLSWSNQLQKHQLVLSFGNSAYAPGLAFIASLVHLLTPNSPSRSIIPIISIKNSAQASHNFNNAGSLVPEAPILDCCLVQAGFPALLHVRVYPRGCIRNALQWASGDFSNKSSFCILQILFQLKPYFLKLKFPPISALHIICPQGTVAIWLHPFTLLEYDGR